MPLVTVEDAAILYRRAEGTVRSWISLDNIVGQPQYQPGRRGAPRKLYPLEQLQDAYERRHGDDDRSSSE